MNDLGWGVGGGGCFLFWLAGIFVPALKSSFGERLLNPTSREDGWGGFGGGGGTDYHNNI